MRVFQLLFLLFLLVPIIEIWLLIEVGGLIGAIPTIALVVFTAVLGALLLRQQGYQTLERARSTARRGELPALAVLEGVVLLVSGALLLTPGFATDTIGFLGLVPPLRRWAILRLLKNATVVTTAHGPRPGPYGRDEDRGPRTLEGEYRREDD